MSCRPFALMIAGPNGSGKTTLTEELRMRGVDFGRYINADEIAKTLTGSYEERVGAAQREADRLRAECLEEGASFSFETVMSHASKPEILARARRLGFVTMLYFVATEDSGLNVERVRQRVALGGHPVPESRIVARYGRTLALLPDAMKAADRIVLFDNSKRSGPGAPVLMRPFLQYDVGRAPPLSVEGDIPAWGSAAVELAMSLPGPGRAPTN